MAKSEGQKMKLFVLKDILERETDATHGITMARILELLSMRGIKAERKSIYDDLRAFREQDILDGLCRRDKTESMLSPAALLKFLS